MKFRDKTRPVALVPVFGNLPDELKALPNWVMWAYRWIENADKPGYWNKPPLQSNNRFARSDDPATWASFPHVVLTYQKNQNLFDGVGIMLQPGLGLTGVDLDNCVTRDNGQYVLTPYAARVVELLNTYTEISPSGTGLRLIVRGNIPQAFKHAGSVIELYQDLRYLTLTGHLWRADSNRIAENQSALTRIYEGVTAQREKARQAKQTAPVSFTVPDLTIAERLERAFAAKNGAKTRRLFDGDTSGYQHGDAGQSEADMALCALLAFWSDNDPGTLDAMFRASRLMRRKWDERRGAQTYGQLTVEHALSNCTEFFGQGTYTAPAQVSKPGEKSKPLPPLTEDEARRRRSGFRFRMGDLADAAIRWRRERGTQETFSTGFPVLDEYYKPVLGAMTIVTGWPNMGKSMMLDNIIGNLSFRYGWKHSIVSWETQPCESHALGLASLYYQKTWSVNLPNSLTDDEIKTSFEALHDYFVFYALPQCDRNMSAVLDCVADDIRDIGIQGFLFDPWSELTPPSRLVGSMTHFVQGNLELLNAFVKANNIHNWTVVHPGKRSNLARSAVGQRKPATLEDCLDSAHFENKADYGLSVHRPYMGEPTEYTEVHVTKVRRHFPGRLGVSYFNYCENGTFIERPDKPLRASREEGW